jgi:hypothetical protein
MICPSILINSYSSLIPTEKDSAEDDIMFFLLVVRLMNVLHEDVFYRLFSYNFVNKASTWLFSPEEASITSWREFETTFIETFGEDKTPTTLVLDFSRIKMEAK